MHIWIRCISIPAVTATYGFALTARPFSKRRKGTKRLCPTTRCLAVARHALSPALLRGSPRWAIPGPARLNRRPAGFPTAQCLRSASVVNGAPRSKTKARRPDDLTLTGVPRSPGASMLRAAFRRWSSTMTLGTWQPAVLSGFSRACSLLQG